VRDEDLLKLKQLVEAAEKAARAEDWDAASDRTDEGEDLISNWTPDRQSRPEEAALIERLRAVEDQFEEEDATAENEDGI
jgi:hypothetical protein